MEFRVADNHGFQGGVFLKGKVILLKDGNSLVFSNRDFPPVVFCFTGKNLEKSGFSRPVCPDYSVTVAGGEFQVYVLKKGAFPITEAEISNGYHVLQTYKKPAFSAIAPLCFFLL